MVKRSRIYAFILIVILFASLAGFTTDTILKNQKLGLDLQGGFEVLYEVHPVNEGDKITEATLSHTKDALDRRINALGVSEPRIDIEEGNRIRVQLAGVEDQDEAREMLSTTAVLTFRDADDNKLLDGTDLVEGGAEQSFHPETGKPIVTLKLKDASKFAEATQKVLQNDNPVMVIWLDFDEEVDSYKEEALKENPKFISAAGVKSVINSEDVMIEGNFTVDEAQTLASLLNAGALPVKLEEIYSNSVGAQFGVDALQNTVYAGMIGLILVFIFLIAFYRLPGLVAVVTLGIYIYTLLAVYDGLNAVLTLPGIAALLLGVAMSVDANIITFERIKEELKVGRSLPAAFKEGSKTSFITIFDANITTLLTAVVLFIYGTSAVKGFATMLIVSILLSFGISVYLARLLLGLLVSSNKFNDKPRLFGVKPEDIMDIKEGLDTDDLKTKFDKIDFVKHKNKFFIASAGMVIAGIIMISVFRLNLSIDFTSGTRIDLMSDESLTTEQVKADLEEHGVETDDIVLSGENHDRATARYKGTLTKDQVNEMKDYFSEKYGTELSISVVTPTVGKDLVRNAIISVILASVGIILYVTLRFEMKMALGAIIALLHDAFFVVAFFSIFRLEVDLNFIAAVLTIIGYSVNDTIVTFDRIRELMRKRKRIREYRELEEIVNKSIRQVLNRSINTSLTTLFPVLCLLLFGADAIWNFSFAMFIGLIAGVYSTLYIAAQLWLVWKGKELKKKGVIITYKEKKKYTGDAVV